jgi:hypothetical protein
MSNEIQQYDGGNGGRDWGKLIMAIAFAYMVMPDALPGPVDDMGGILLALVVVGVMSLFGGAK